MTETSKQQRGDTIQWDHEKLRKQKLERQELARRIKKLHRE